MTLSKHLHELLGWRGPMTHRQFRVWKAWLELDQERPSRSDHYAMQIACEVRRVPYAFVGKDPNDVKLETFKLKRKQDGEQQQHQKPQGDCPWTLEEMENKMLKQVWFARMGMSERPMKIEERKRNGN